MIEASMDSAHVNWSVLDSLVLDYAESEELLKESVKNPENFRIRHIIKNIRSLIEQGCITDALGLIEEHAPSVLQDQKLVFQLNKQKFIELLRTGESHGRDQAIQCSRNVLRPCALDAYPEAYEEFKRLLLALIYNKDDKNSPVVEEWSEARRFELAATVASVLRAHFRAYDPLLSLLLRYLISTHNSYCFRQGLTSSIAKLSETLISKEKDPAATPQDCLLEAPSFAESDVQALAHAVDLSRQGAVDSLRCTGGDLVLALKNELSRIKLNTGVLDDLVYGYCIYRGLIDGAFLDTNRDRHIEPEQSDLHDNSARVDPGPKASTVSDPSVEQKDREATTQEYIDTDQSQHIVRDGEDATMLEQADALSEQSVEGESSHADSCNISESICSTSDYVTLKQKSKNTVRKKSHMSYPRKRWKGRSTETLKENLIIEGGSLMSSQTNEDSVVSNPATGLKKYDIDKFGLALEVREMLCEGMISEVIQKVMLLDPQIFDSNPHLIFQLKQIEFIKLIERGNNAEALNVARRDLGPLAAQYTDLLKPLKETLLAFTRPQGESFVKPLSPSVLGATLQATLNTSLGISEPELMNIIKVTLSSHSEWFKLQMCHDLFADMLNINALKDAESGGIGSLNGNTTPEASVISSKPGASKISSSDDGSAVQHPDSARDGSIFDDNSILTVMEWMALSRGDAIQLLAQYGGSVESVLEHLLS